MKRLVFIVFFLSCCSFLFGQFSNDWINYSQKYYKIPITSEGVYRITYADLLANGISVGDFDHRNLQIIHNGESLPLFVSAQADGIFRNTDYFEFYAESGNTGWLDSKVYSSEVPLNPAYSLYTDTASYFLTFANTLESPRYDTVRNQNYSAFNVLNYCLKTVRNNYISTFNETNSSSYVLPGEGWCDSYFDMGESVQKGIITTNYSSVGVPSKISFGVAGFSETPHSIKVTLASDESIRYQKDYENYNAIHETIITNQPLSSTTVLKFQSIQGEGTADKNSVAYVEVVYPCNLNCNNQSFAKYTVPVVDLGEYILLEFVNFNAGSNAPILFCPELQKRILTTLENGKYRVLIPNMHKEVDCILLSQNAYSRVSSIQAAQSKTSSSTKYVDYSLEENQGDYIIITEKSLWQQAKLYQQYRQQTGQHVVLVDIDELYDQFAYGIRKHPYAISAFLDFAIKNWSITPEHVFLIGKGFHIPNNRNDENLYERTLIPGMGNPASDLLFTMDMRAKSIRPNIAIGRLAAESPDEVKIYRNKVMDYESQEAAPWMKNVIHFGGGTTAYEQSTFRRYLTQYANSLRGEYFGADIHSFYKESSDVYETTEPAAIRKLMNEGTVLVTFFGHASGSGFDQNIDHPSLFDNQGRYPLIVANSCYSGDVFADNDYNVSNIWTFTENKGSIGFLANVGTGVPTYLNIFSSAFMRNIASQNYGNSIGSSVAKTMHDLSNKNIIYEELYDGIAGFTLQGDPIVKLPSFNKPDFVIDETSIFFTPQIISTEQDNFTFNIALRNYGRAYASNFSIRATFTPGNGAEPFVFETEASGSFCKDTLSFVMNMENFSSGEYTVMVEIDYDDVIPELSEDNNVATVSFFVSSREVLPIYPCKNAIIATDTVSLYMSSVDPFNPPTEIMLELDTTATYNSPLYQSVILQSAGKATHFWIPEGRFIDSTTYFWRVTSTDSIKWNESSFTYESGQTGWGQIHRHQFTDNKLQSLSYDETTKNYTFNMLPHEISLQTRGNCSTEKEYFECLFVMDATQLCSSGSSLTTPTLQIVVLDQLSLTPWLSNHGYYGQRNYESQDKVFDFTANDKNANQKLASFLLDSVPNGNYILCYSFIKPYCQSWDDSLKNALESLGFSVFKETADDLPYIFFTQKGKPSLCEEVVGEQPNDLIRIDKIISTNLSQGTIKTDKIGPAKTVHKILWSTEKRGKDEMYLTVFQKTKDEELYVLGNLFESSWPYLDSIYKTEYYPFLQLNCNVKDDERTPGKLNYWKVYYTPAAELAVEPHYLFDFHNDTIQQGDSARLVCSVRNVSETLSDSVLVMYEIRNEQNELIDLQYKRIRSIKGFEYYVDTQYFSTRNLIGNYILKVEFNSVDPETGMYDQGEAEHFNNFCYHNFTVVPDRIAPIFDVLVDGRHLVNEDKVSSQPEIKISLVDENEYFKVVGDTSLFHVAIVNLQTNVEYPCYFADSTLFFVPSESDINKSSVICRPLFLDEGSYELQVHARDVSGNYASPSEYVVQFEVSLNNEVSSLYNFPNPCRESTTFRFVLSGAQKPKNACINVADNNGRFVASIPIKNVHIGINDVDVRWDKYGNPLSKGVYFYRLDFDDFSSWSTKTIKPNVGLWGKLIIE